MRRTSSPLRPCPCCKGTDGRCLLRDNGAVWCYHVREEAQAPEGWIFIHTLNGGMGSSLRPQRDGEGEHRFFTPKDDELQDALAADALRQQVTNGGKKLTQEEFDKQIHEQFLRLLTPLAMEGEAERDNRRRGARNRTVRQMELQGHRQIRHGDVVGSGLEMLPHVDNGRWSGPSAELMPLLGEDGRIVACQMRCADGSQRWLSSDAKPMHRLDGSWPASFHNLQPGDELNGCDGIKKSALLAAATGMPFWGSAGSRYMLTSPQIRKVLSKICPPELGNFRVVINVDAGDATNFSGIANEILKFARVVTGWGYTVLIRDWGQKIKPGKDDEGAEFCDLDELLLQHPEEGLPQKLITPQEFYEALDQRVQRTVERDALSADYSLKGVHVFPKHRIPDLEPPTPRREPRYFAEGEFVRALRQAFAANKFVHDARQMGLGKSYDISHLEPEQLGFTRIVWVSSNHLDTWHEANQKFADVPTSPWEVMRGRDSGRQWDTGNRIVRKNADNADKAEALAANCIRADIADENNAKGLELKAKTICKRCPSIGTCKSSSEWFLKAREETLQASRIICHPLNLEAVPVLDHLGRPFDPKLPPEEQQPGTLIVLEEANLFPFVRTITFSVSDVLAHATFAKDSGLNTQILCALETFARCVRGKMNVEFSTIWSALQEEVKPGGYDADDEHLMQVWEEEQVEAGNFSKAWMRPFLSVLSGDGRVWVEGQRVTLMVRNQNLIDCLKHRGVSVLFSDGSAATEEFEEWIDAPVATIARRPPNHAPAEIHQIYGLGRLGYGRAANDRAKVDATINVLIKKFNLQRNHAVIDISREAKDRDRSGQLALGWMQSSRGSNICVNEDIRDLVIVGAPLPPVTVALHRYCLRTGRMVGANQRQMVFRKFWTPADSGGQMETNYIEGSYESADPGFRRELRGILEREVEQGRHRLREVRRGTADDPVRVFFISDACIPSWELAGLHDFEELVGSRVQVSGLTRSKILAAAAAVDKQERVGMRSLAKELGVSIDDLKAAMAEFDLTIRKLRQMERPKQVSEKAKAQAAKHPEQDADRPSSTMVNRLPLGTTVSYRDQLEGEVVGYQGGIPEKVIIRVLDSEGEEVEQALPADLVHVSQIFS